jgi:hypothetical protein
MALSSTKPGHRNFSYDIVKAFFIQRTLQDLARYPWILDIIDLKTYLRSTCLQGLLEVGSVRLLAAMLGDLGVSTLCSIKTMTQFFSLLGASNQPWCLLQCSGTTVRVRLRRPVVFLVVPTY